MSNVAVTISFQNEEGRLETIVLDTVEDTTVNGSSTITEYPMVNGDIVSDHAIVEPISLSLSGSFALNGSNQIIVDDGGARLASIEKFFEDLQRNATLCEIVKVTVSAENQARFLRRSSMCLKSYSWTEKISSLDYTLNFKQVLLVDIQEPEDVVIDENLPDINAPKTSNFTETLFDVNQFDAQLITVLKSEKLIADDFIDYMKGLDKAALLAVGVAVVAALLVVQLVPLIGQAASIAIVIAAAAVTMVFSLIKLIKRKIAEAKYKMQAFQYYKNKKKLTNETQRFSEFVENMHNQLQKLNDALKVYKIPSDGAQECLLQINDDMYDFIFTRDNTTNHYNLSVIDMTNDERQVKFANDVNSSALKGIAECTLSNYLFETDDQVYVYLIQVDEEKQTDQGTIKLGSENLSTYYIFVSSINMEKYTELLNELILEQLKK